MPQTLSPAPHPRRPEPAETLLEAVRQRQAQLSLQLVQQWVHRRGVLDLQRFCATRLSGELGAEAMAWLLGLLELEAPQQATGGVVAGAGSPQPPIPAISAATTATPAEQSLSSAGGVQPAMGAAPAMDPAASALAAAARLDRAAANGALQARALAAVDDAFAALAQTFQQDVRSIGLRSGDIAGAGFGNAPAAVNGVAGNQGSGGKGCGIEVTGNPLSNAAISSEGGIDDQSGGFRAGATSGDVKPASPEIASHQVSTSEIPSGENASRRIGHPSVRHDVSNGDNGNPGTGDIGSIVHGEVQQRNVHQRNVQQANVQRASIEQTSVQQGSVEHGSVDHEGVHDNDLDHGRSPIVHDDSAPAASGHSTSGAAKSSTDPIHASRIATNASVPVGSESGEGQAACPAPSAAESTPVATPTAAAAAAPIAATADMAVAADMAVVADVAAAGAVASPTTPTAHAAPASKGATGDEGADPSLNSKAPAHAEPARIRVPPQPLPVGVGLWPSLEASSACLASALGPTGDSQARPREAPNNLPAHAETPSGSRGGVDDPAIPDASASASAAPPPEAAVPDACSPESVSPTIEAAAEPQTGLLQDLRSRLREKRLPRFRRLRAVLRDCLEESVSLLRAPEPPSSDADVFETGLPLQPPLAASLPAQSSLQQASAIGSIEPRPSARPTAIGGGEQSAATHATPAPGDPAANGSTPVPPTPDRPAPGNPTPDTSSPDTSSPVSSAPDTPGPVHRAQDSRAAADSTPAGEATPAPAAALTPLRPTPAIGNRPAPGRQRPAPVPACLSDLRAWLPDRDDLPRAS